MMTLDKPCYLKLTGSSCTLFASELGINVFKHNALNTQKTAGLDFYFVQLNEKKRKRRAINAADLLLPGT
ncbi:MAG: hypothetical protein WC782_02610 [Methylococcaceae bacterium]|jgi:hypothetical protein